MCADGLYMQVSLVPNEPTSPCLSTRQMWKADVPALRKHCNRLTSALCFPKTTATVRQCKDLLGKLFFVGAFSSFVMTFSLLFRPRSKGGIRSLRDFEHVS